jgi:D-amino-acid dehydrogenase
MNVVVVGAGIVGLATAYELVKAGHRVRVIDKNVTVGQGASGGNGAQLSYSYVQPLADPSIWAQLPKLLLQKDSPLKLRPSLAPHQWRWLCEFMQACTGRQSQLGTRTLLALGALSRQRFDSMRLALDIPASTISYQQNGKLVLYRSTKSYQAARQQVDFQKNLNLGGTQFAITAAEAFSLEPSLDGGQDDIVGAIHTPSECVVDCQKLCETLATKLAALGVDFSMACSAFDVGQANSYWVVCAGTQSYDIAKSFGVRVPIYPIKGYSISVPIRANSSDSRDNRLSLSVTDSAKKLVFAPLGAGAATTIRVAGYAELVGADMTIEKSKIQSLLQAMQTVFPRLYPMPAAEVDPLSLQPWAGLRPATPTGIPIIGRVAGMPANVLFNTGHGALGLTLAFGSAYRLSQLITEPL